jgi:hypothetical protein
MRQLLEGANAEDEEWGTLESERPDDVSTPHTPKQLARALYSGIVEQRDVDWERAFVSAGRYASLVEVPLDKARNFVDGKQGEAEETRGQFAIENPSEAPSKGLSSIFELEGLELGEGRTLDGDLAGDGETVTQYWDNRLRLSMADEDVAFHLKVPKILRIPRRSDEADGEPGVAQLGIASKLRIGPRLRVFLETGMHLKPELLRSFEYPIPLAVGNFWRYARTTPGEGPRGTDPAQMDNESRSSDDSERNAAVPFEASRVTVKVRSIDRYGTRRLVDLQWLYNAADLTQRTEHWLATPRRIYVCPRPCRRHIDDLSWILSYLRRQTPVVRFPLARNSQWGTSSADGDTAFTVAENWQNLELPAGSFFGVFEVRGTGPLRSRIPFQQVRSLRRFVAPGTGIVRRRYGVASDQTPTVIESLTDYRLMTR